jgi:hypothetical protein
MKNNSLHAQCVQLYKQTEQQIYKGASELTDEGKWIEWGFGLAMKTWLEVERMTNSYPFLHRDEEINFYKTLKPGFTGLIEYFTLLYKSIVFQPEDPLQKDAYWKRELKTCLEFISLFRSGCMYYEQQPDKDQYFLQQNNQQPLIFGLNVNEFNFSAISYTYLLGRLIAVKKYKKYIQAQC